MSWSWDKIRQFTIDTLSGYLVEFTIKNRDTEATRTRTERVIGWAVMDSGSLEPVIFNNGRPETAGDFCYFERWKPPFRVTWRICETSEVEMRAQS